MSSLIFLSIYAQLVVVEAMYVHLISEDDPSQSVLFGKNRKRMDTLEYFSVISTILYTRPRLGRTRLSGKQSLTG